MQGTPEHVTPELLEASKPTNLDANKQKLTEEELDAKYLVAQENTEKSALDFLKNVQGLPELSHALNTMNSYKDPISGEVNLGRVKQIVEEMNLDLGQAYEMCIRDRNISVGKLCNVFRTGMNFPVKRFTKKCSSKYARISPRRGFPFEARSFEAGSKPAFLFNNL